MILLISSFGNDFLRYIITVKGGIDVQILFIVLGIIAACIAAWFLAVKFTVWWLDNHDITNSKKWQVYTVFVLHMALTWPIFIYINRRVKQ